MFKNKFQITSLVTVVFLTLSLVFLSFIFFVIEEQANREYGHNDNDIWWWILIGLFSVTFIVTLGLFFRIDLVRKFIQLISAILIFGFCGFIYYRSVQLSYHPLNFLDLVPMMGTVVWLFSFMLAVFTLFENEVVKEEFGRKEASKSDNL